LLSSFSLTSIFFMPVMLYRFCFYSAKPQDSSQLEELVSRVSALQGLFLVFCVCTSHVTFAHIHYSGLGEKETLSSQHLAELQKQREETARLKVELIQLTLQHNTDLKQAVEAGKDELDYARKELTELHAREIKEVQDQLHGELKAEKDLRELEKKHNDALQEVRSTQAKIIADLDEKVRSKFFPSFVSFFVIPASSYTGIICYFPQRPSRSPKLEPLRPLRRPGMEIRHLMPMLGLLRCT
jgi:hypothetical protein